MKRYEPLDVFRGMTMALMIVLNTPGSWSHVYSPFLHASWHGFTPTDLVFPSFLFAVGNSMAFVSKKWVNLETKDVLLKGVKRGFLIFLAGYLLYWFPFFRPNAEGVWHFKTIDTTRIFGVLQRIGTCYILAMVLVVFVKGRALVYSSLLILLGYWGVMYLFGDYSLEASAARILDLNLLGAGHMYGGEGIPFDPEGILSTFPAVINVIGGYLVGVFIRDKGSSFEMLAKLMLMGCFLMFGSYIWDLGFPINKKIWTSSYVLLTVGMDMVILGGIIYLMEFNSNKWKFSVFNTYGKNPLFIFLLSGVVAKMMYLIKIGDANIYHLTYVNGFEWLGDKPGSLAFALSFALLYYLISLWMERKKIFIRI